MLRAFIEKPAFFYCNVLLLFFLSNGLFTKGACRIDLSHDGVNSVSASTKQVFSSLDAPVLLETYVSRQVSGEIASGLEPILSILHEMERVAKGKIHLRIYEPDTQELRQKAEERGIRGLPIAQQKDIEASVRLGYFGIYLQKGDDSVVIPLIDRNWFVGDVEYRILREIKRFGKAKEDSNIAFLQAPGTVEIKAWTTQADQNKDNLYGFKSTLERELGKTQEIKLDAPVPSSVKSLLIIGLPRLEEKEIYYLDQFLMRGANLICMLRGFQFEMRPPDPRLAQLGLAGGSSSLGASSIEEAELNGLNAWLSKYGITLKGEIILEPRQAMPVWDFNGRFPLQIPYPAWAIYARGTGNIIGKEPALAPVEQLVFPWFSSIDVKEALQANASFETLVQSSQEAIALASANLGYQEVQSLARSTAQRLGYRAKLAVMAKGKFQTAYPQAKVPQGIDKALHLEKQTAESTSHIVVISTPYMLADILFRHPNGAQIFHLNNAFLMNLLEAVEGDTELAAARSRKRTLFTMNLSSKALQSLITWGFSLGLPFSLGLWGALRLARRNRKRGL